MDRPSEEIIRRLLEATRAMSESRVDALIDEARAEAEAEVRQLLKSALKAAMLQRAVARLEGAPPTTAELAIRPAAVPLLAKNTSSPDPREAESDAPPACYVYGLTFAGDALPASTPPGIDEAHPVRVVRQGPVQAIVSGVKLEAFAAASLEQRLNDPRWVEAKVRSHDAVLASVLAIGAVVPCRFCTVLRDEADVRRLLAAHRDHLLDTLHRLERKTEWGVKVYARPVVARDPSREEENGSGKAYLHRRRHEVLRRRRHGEELQALADSFHGELTAHAAESATLACRDTGLILNGAYLVSEENAEPFKSIAAAFTERHAARGFAAVVTGPWPAYNFARLNLSLEAAA